MALPHALALVLLATWPACSGFGGEDGASRQQRLLADFYDTYGPDWEVTWSEDGRRVTTLLRSSGSGRPGSGRPGSGADGEHRQFLEDVAALLGLQGPDDWILRGQDSSPGDRHYGYQQLFQGLAVENAWIQVNADPLDHVLSVISSTVSPAPELTWEAEVGHEQAVEIALAAFGDLEDLDTAAIEEVFFPADGGRLLPAFKVLVRSRIPPRAGAFVVDATTGEILQTETP